MATVKGFVRAYAASYKRVEREQQRKAREAAKRYKAQQKQIEIANAEEAVTDYNRYVKLIQSLHKNCTSEINWQVIKETPKPEEPLQTHLNEVLAQTKLDNFRPSIFNKIFKSTEKKVTKLENNIIEAKNKDAKILESEKEKYLNELENWQLLQKMAVGLEEQNTEIYKVVLGYFDPFSDIGELGVDIEFEVQDNGLVDIDVYINGEEVIPDYELKQTASGKLSKKKMSKTKYYEMYQDHICSSIIRVSRELFAYLPLDKARVNAIGRVLNSSTGYNEDKPIISVIMVPETIKSLNMYSIDPSDSLQNFVHNMKFSKTKGFKIVDKVELK